MEDASRNAGAPETAEAATLVCRRLRTKMYYVMGRDHVDLREASPTGQYWCSRTATVLGPDDVLCSPRVCQPHRACFDPLD